MLLPQDPSHSPRSAKPWRVAGLAIGLWFATPAVYGQTADIPAAVSGGQGEIAAQGYYMGGNQQDLLSTTGTSLRFQEFVPNIGLFTGSLEGYASQNRFETGENFLELRGLPWAGHYWTFSGGDFRAPATVVELPFTNLYTPEIDARGVKVQAVHGDTQYMFFAGQETLSAGPRVPYRIEAPQVVMGVSAVRKVAPHLLVGARVMQYSAGEQSIADNPYLFPPGRTAALVRTMAAQSLYTPVKHLKIYGEVSKPQASGERQVTSVLTGLTWEGPVFTLKANYVSQGILYFPLAGYFAGDRRGPYAEAHLRPWKRLDFYASASQYRNNLERDATLPDLTSNNVSVGTSALLPGKVSFTGQFSAIRFSAQEPGEDYVSSNDRQISASLTRGIGRQTFQLNWREINLDMQPSPQRQRSTELGDTYQFKHFALGGTVRYQQVTGSERLNSLFFRGLAQVNFGRISAYANVEVGNDLANQTVFSTEAYRTSVVGASVQLPAKWNLQTEVFRNQLNLTLNEENVFLLQNGDTLAGISPAAASLNNFGQWSLFFRLSRQVRWGAGLPTEGPAGATGGTTVRLTGNIEGVIRLKTLAVANWSAASIPVSLDNGRTAVSGPDGHYFFTNVPEGAHEVGLAMAELPADFDPGELQKTQILVQPNRVARADFEVLPLTSISGRVKGPDKVALEDIVIRLLPGSRYTTTDKDGSFTFYNVREGDFDVAIDPDTLPEGGVVESPASVRVAARVGSPASSIEFVFNIRHASKPVRKVLHID